MPGLACSVALACSVGLLDETGKQCSDVCPGGLPCVQGRCGGAPTDGEAAADDGGPAAACLPPDGASRPGPEMAWIAVGDGGFCIDTTEVTNADFNDYLVQSGALLDLPAACATDAGPPYVVKDPTLAQLPALGMTFCYAWSYCRWAGKRLCGLLGTGGVASSAADPHTLEWYYACANGRQDTIYPYGDSLQDGACNVGTGSPVAAGSVTGCHGTDAPFASVFDMVGNAAEYIDNVDPGGNVAAVGGSYDAFLNGGDVSCSWAKGFNGVAQGVGAVGVRCCADP
jgi:sulfatase modifying factor 1